MKIGWKRVKEQEEREGEREKLQFSWYARSPNTLATYACLRTANASRSGSGGMLGTIIVPSRMRKHCAYMHRMTTCAGGRRARPLHRNRHVSPSLLSPPLSLSHPVSGTLSQLCACYRSQCTPGYVSLCSYRQDIASAS